MLTGIIGRSLIRRRRRKLLVLSAVALGITVATAVATIALDVGDKVSRELRSFGANIAVTPAADSLPVVIGGVDYRAAGAGAFLNETDLPKLKKIFWQHNIIAFAPYLYVPVDVNGKSTVAIGTWFANPMRISDSERFTTGVRSMHPGWMVSGTWPVDEAASACLVGRRLAHALGLRPGADATFTVADHSDSGHSQHPPASATLQVAGILTSGGPEDDQIMAPLTVVQRVAGLEGKIRRVEVSALTKPDDDFARSDPKKMTPEQLERWSCSPYVRSIAHQIAEAIPGAEAKPVYQVAESEGRIVGRVGLLMWTLVLAGLVTAGLAVASMMLASVLERRTEIGLFKSLGATNAGVAAILLLESAAIGVVGGVVGYFIGSLLANRVSISVFGVATTLHWVLLPGALALALGVAILGSAFPLARALRIDPATVLRN
jgi:putative ABC transport system permease protein